MRVHSGSSCVRPLDPPLVHNRNKLTALNKTHLLFIE